MEAGATYLIFKTPETICTLHSFFRVRVGSVGKKESRDSQERRDHRGLKVPQATMALKGTL